MFAWGAKPEAGGEAQDESVPRPIARLRYPTPRTRRRGELTVRAGGRKRLSATHRPAVAQSARRASSGRHDGPGDSKEADYAKSPDQT